MSYFTKLSFINGIKKINSLHELSSVGRDIIIYAGVGVRTPDGY